MRSKNTKRKRRNYNYKNEHTGGNNERNPPSSSKFCSVCNEENSKYKCPKCRSFYCSVGCCKKHKENCIGVILNKNDTNHMKSQYVGKALPQEEVREKIEHRKILASTSTEDTQEEEWRLTPGTISRLETNDWLREEIKSDGGLRQILVDIDTSNDRFAALETAKLNYPNFSKFIDKMLLSCGMLIENTQIPGDLIFCVGQKDQLTSSVEIVKENDT